MSISRIPQIAHTPGECMTKHREIALICINRPDVAFQHSPPLSARSQE